MIGCAKNLLPAKAIAESDYDGIFTNYRVSQANLAIAQAAVKQCEATLRIAKSNLNYTVIKSPIDGVIIDRRIDVGQTVVAAFNAPGLFLIADLQQMQVWASVNETDIAQIHPGLPVRFTVNTFPDEVFQGAVAQIRLNATRNEKSANYTVVVDAKDTKGILPYLTANVQFDIQNDPNVLLIPNDAFQWQPQPTQTVPEELLSEGKNYTTHEADMIPSSEVKVQDPVKIAMHRKGRLESRRLWVKDGEICHPVDVQTGASDGVMTEVLGNNVKEGMDVLLGGHAHRELSGRSRDPWE